MKRSGFLISVGIAIAACVACAPPPREITTKAYTAFCDASKTDPFLKHVRFLQSPFAPTYPGGQTPPASTPIDSVPTAGNISKDLEDAFNAAAPVASFQQKLCSLDGVYINPCVANNYNPNSCSSLADIDVANNSWGYRTIPPQSLQEYIAISLGLWKNGGQAPFYRDYESNRLQALLEKTGRPLTPTPNPPIEDPSKPAFSRVSPANANTAAFAVLAALAHEYGHVFWYDAFVVKSNGMPNPGGSVDTTVFCGGSFYSPPSATTPSWTAPVTTPPYRWLAFGDIRNGHPPGTDIQGLKSHLQIAQQQGSYSDFRLASDVLASIYQNSQWASALAAFSPEEDFVETFQLFILTNASPKLQEARVHITGLKRIYEPNVLDNLNQSTELGRKAACFQQALCSTCSL